MTGGGALHGLISLSARPVCWNGRLLRRRGRSTALPPAPVHVPQMPTIEPLAAQLDHFVECCRLGLTPESDGMAGTNVVRVLEAANGSLRDGGRIVDLEELALVR